MRDKSYLQLNIALLFIYAFLTYNLYNLAQKHVYSKINVIKLNIDEGKVLEMVQASRSAYKEYASIINAHTKNKECGKLETKQFDQERYIQMTEGSTFSSTLQEFGIDNTQIVKFSNALGKFHSNLHKGQNIAITYDYSSKYEKEMINNEIYPQRYKFIEIFFVKNMELRLNKVEKIISITQDASGTVKASHSDLQTEKKIKAVKTTISNSLYYDAIKNGVTPIVINKMIEQYSYSIDFQRDIQPGDELEVVFEEYFDDKGKKVKDGKLLYAGLKVHKKWQKLYRYKEDFFDESGRSIKKSLLKTPVDGARISSTFGTRRHPVLGFTRAHKGVDFAAPTGTPIYAAGDGIITFAAWGGGYGNLVSIKHNKEFGTNYAHMSRFAKGIKKGSSVKQRQIIGYIGTTGLSTGPHLHFELVKNGVKINPQVHTIKSDIFLSGNQLTDLKKFITEMQNKLK